MAIYGPDIASYQGTPNMGAVRGAGNDFVIIKVTESTNYINPTWAANRDNAHAAGLIVFHYHFARNGDPIAEARYFVNTLGGLRDGEGVVLDWEVAGDAANWSKAWLDEVQRLTGVKAFVYLNQYYVNNFNWQPVKDAGYPLWVAIYDGDPWTFQPMRFWGAPLLKQYTDAAQIPGIAGNVDRNSFNGSREDLLAYTLGGDDMPSAQEVADAVWRYGLIAGAEPGVGPADAGTYMRFIADQAAVARSMAVQTQDKVVYARLDLSDRPGPDADDMLGQILSTRAELRALAAKVAGLGQAPAVDIKELAAEIISQLGGKAKAAKSLKS